MTKQTKGTIDLFVSTGITGAVAYYLFFKKKTDVKELAVICLVVFLVCYMLVSRITRGIKAADDSKINAIVEPAPISEFNPAPIGQALYQDIYEVWGFRNKDIYYQLVALPDSHLVSVCKYWNDNYLAEDNETLRQAIAGETLGWELNSTWETLEKRFDNLKIN